MTANELSLLLPRLRSKGSLSHSLRHRLVGPLKPLRSWLARRESGRRHTRDMLHTEPGMIRPDWARRLSSWRWTSAATCNFAAPSASLRCFPLLHLLSAVRLC